MHTYRNWLDSLLGIETGIIVPDVALFAPNRNWLDSLLGIETIILPW